MHPEKVNIVADLNQKLSASPYLIVVDYTGLKVSQFAELRNRLHASGSRCQVIKNSFLRLAMKDAGLPELADLAGQNAMVFGDSDVAAAAKVLKTFKGEFQKPSIRTGVVDRMVLEADQLNAIADLPSREVLLATLLGVINAPASKLVRTINEPASALARVLKAKADKEEGVAA